MNQSLLNQNSYIRGVTIKNLKQTNEDIANLIPSGFNNNLRWNFGHILVTQEAILFGLERAYQNLPKHYQELFHAGTKPADWTGDVPSLERLAIQLQEQSERVEKVFASRLDQKLPQPYTTRSGLTMETFGEMLTFLIYHEGIHLGYINAMKKALG